VVKEDERKRGFLGWSMTVLVAAGKRYLMMQSRKWAGKSLKTLFFLLTLTAGLALGGKCFKGNRMVVVVLFFFSLESSRMSRPLEFYM